MDENSTDARVKIFFKSESIILVYVLIAVGLQWICSLSLIFEFLKVGTYAAQFKRYEGEMVCLYHIHPRIIFSCFWKCYMRSAMYTFYIFTSSKPQASPAVFVLKVLLLEETNLVTVFRRDLVCPIYEGKNADYITFLRISSTVALLLLGIVHLIVSSFTFTLQKSDMATVPQF